MKRRPLIVGLTFGVLFSASLARADEPAFDRKEDVIYGRKFGTALTMDVFTPKANCQRRGDRPGGQRRVRLLARRESIRPTSGRCSTGATRSSPSSMAASLTSPSPRSSTT